MVGDFFGSGVFRLAGLDTSTRAFSKREMIFRHIFFEDTFDILTCQSHFFYLKICFIFIF